MSDATGWHIEIIIPEDVLFGNLNRIGEMIGILKLIELVLLLYILYRAIKDNKKIITSKE